MRLKHSQNETGVIPILEGLLVTALLAVVVFAGYQYYQSRNPQSSSAQPSPNSATISYRNQELGLAFVYPASWGEVKLDPENLYKGKGYRISFTKQSRSQGTIRSKDYELAPPGLGRGGAYWDAPALFSNAWNGDSASSAPVESSALLAKTTTYLIDAYCSDHSASAGIEAYVKLGGTVYDVVKFLYLVREPKPDGSGADFTGCDNPKRLVAPIQDEYLTFIKSVKPL